MADTPYALFPASQKPSPPGTLIGPVPPDELIDISLYLTPRELPPGTTRAIVHAADITAVKSFAAAAGLTITAIEPARRLIRLRGTAKAMQTTFRTELHHYQDGAHTFRGRSGMLSMPAAMLPFTQAVLGLDTRKIAAPRIRKRRPGVTAASYLPNQVAKLYSCPPNLTGAGQCIALIELGGGYLASDTKTAFAAMGLTPPEVLAITLDGGANKPTPDDGADGEVALDIQVAGGVAPAAKIAVYFTVNTDAGFVDAITAATADSTNNPKIISISWGGPESTWTPQAQSAMNSALADAASASISVFVAAGDNLATDGVPGNKAEVDFPASSPWAIGCGGTLITVSDNKITAETVWNEGSSGTGGGISEAFPIPAFQSAVKLPPNVTTGAPGRGVPDIACNADPNSGYQIIVSGQQEVVGGTSAAAPFWAGLTALINQNAATPAGFFLPQLYAAPNAVRDITKGNNKPTGSEVGYTAAPGWDACTGLGVPIGTALLSLLAQPPVI
jgi:kumamolisin